MVNVTFISVRNENPPGLSPAGRVRFVSRKARGAQSRRLKYIAIILTLRYRLSLLACAANHWRLRFLIDRRRRFIGRARLLNLGQVVLSRGPVNLPVSRKFPTAPDCGATDQLRPLLQGALRQSWTPLRRCCVSRKASPSVVLRYDQCAQVHRPLRGHPVRCGHYI